MNKYNKEKRIIGMVNVLFLLYIVMSSLGLLFIKLYGKGLSLGVNSKLLSFSVDYRLILGMLFYVTSFFLFMVIVQKFDLTYIYPVAAGILYIVISLIGVLFLKEKVSLNQLIGMGFILIGVVFMNIKK
jgi:multidrug transporter EmrE-like cation transporter